MLNLAWTSPFWAFEKAANERKLGHARRALPRTQSCRQKSGTYRRSHGVEMIPRAELCAFICLSTNATMPSNFALRERTLFKSELRRHSEQQTAERGGITDRTRPRTRRPTPNSEVAHKKLVARTAEMHCGLRRVHVSAVASVGPANRLTTNKCISHTIRGMGIPPRNVVIRD